MSGTTTPIPIIPCMEITGILRDPRDILGYVLRYYTTAPKSISNSTPDVMISMADDVSRYQNNPSSMIEAVTKSLQGIYGVYFPPDSVSVNVSTTENQDNSYNLTIQLAVSVGNRNYALGADVGVSNTGVLKLKWHPNLN